MESQQPLLELVNVTKRFPYRAGPFRRQVGSITAVAGVSLAIQPGEIVGLVGESGCGKTTLAKLICGLELTTAGEVRYQGQHLTNGRRPPRRLRRKIQLVFQDPTSSLDPTQRVGSALSEPLTVHQLATGASQRRRRVQQLLEQVGLPAHYVRRYPRELSGGERQRVAIARALAVEPHLLILDEPVASLDVYVGSQVLDLLTRIHQERRLSYLLISHDLRVIGSMCQRVAVMYLGRLVEVAAAHQLFRQPWHPYTELLLEAAGLRSGPIEDRGELPSPLSPPSGCPFRTRCPLVAQLSLCDTPSPARMVPARSAASICAEEDPALTEKAPGRFVACHFRP